MISKMPEEKQLTTVKSITGVLNMLTKKVPVFSVPILSPEPTVLPMKTEILLKLSILLKLRVKKKILF